MLSTFKGNTATMHGLRWEPEAKTAVAQTLGCVIEDERYRKVIGKLHTISSQCYVKLQACCMPHLRNVKESYKKVLCNVVGRLHCPIFALAATLRFRCMITACNLQTTLLQLDQV